MWKSVQAAESTVWPEAGWQMLVPAHLRSICQVWLHSLHGRTLHILQKNGWGHIIIIVAMDDLTLASNSPSLLLGCKSDLRSKFNITDMGEIHWLLGVEIKRNHRARTVSLSQKAYIDTVCARFRLQDDRAATMPMEAGAHLTDTKEDEPHAKYPYQEIVRSLMYMAT